MAADVRPLPPEPGERGPLQWVATVQGRREKPASCRGCSAAFDFGKQRICGQTDFTSGSGRHLHLHCIPGGLHANDTVQGDPANDANVAARIQQARVPQANEAGEDVAMSSSQVSDVSMEQTVYQAP